MCVVKTRLLGWIVAVVWDFGIVVCVCVCVLCPLVVVIVLSGHVRTYTCMGVRTVRTLTFGSNKK